MARRKEKKTDKNAQLQQKKEQFEAQRKKKAISSLLKYSSIIMVVLLLAFLLISGTYLDLLRLIPGVNNLNVLTDCSMKKNYHLPVCIERRRKNRSDTPEIRKHYPGGGKEAPFSL